MLVDGGDERGGEVAGCVDVEAAAGRRVVRGERRRAAVEHDPVDRTEEPQRDGICDRFDTFLDGSYTVVVLVNYDPPVCEDLADALIDLLAREPTPQDVSSPP